MFRQIRHKIKLKGLRNYYYDLFNPFFRAIAENMAENHEVKGDSWKTMSWVDLMDNLSKQYEDMQDDHNREDYFANIGCYSAMLWSRELEETQA